ncbi:IclR family transcriptional regulator [Schumannella soli]|uniref:Helix-turn-helix domain-containing protein n=1 Tax=Schumannella soli TaxID=2590779 RepID=A0A506XXQ5_9MICO|nr:helix-turn-helix domain-containing protein [Schumannella soli]TPW77551.1 helix-turn-helix domain-containing protein [Schumannella soli]
MARELIGDPLGAPAHPVGTPSLEIEKGAIQSIERAGLVLSLFDRDVHVLSAAFVAERLGMNRTTAHRYLQSLQTSGFLDADNRPGPLLEQLGAYISSRQDVLSVAPPVMRRLSDDTGLTAVMSFLGRSGAIVTLVEEAAAGAVMLTVRIGTLLEAKSAQSRVLLAFQSDPATVGRLHAALEPDAARHEREVLARVRRDRIAWADLGRIGLASVAAPVFGPHNVQAAIALIGTTALLRPGDEPEIRDRVAALRASAELLSDLASS